MYDHTFYKQVLITRSDIRPHIKWAVSLVILHMITSMFLRALCGYIWVNILTFSPRGEGCHMVQTDHMPVGHRGLTLMVFAIRVTGIISLVIYIISFTLNFHMFIHIARPFMNGVL